VLREVLTQHREADAGTDADETSSQAGSPPAAGA